MTEDGVPDALRDVVVVEQRARIGAKHASALAGDRALGAQSLVDRAGHLDIALRTIRFRIVNSAPDQSFANEDESTIEVDVTPLQPVNLPGAACRR